MAGHHESPPIVLGITGNIASGKSSVAAWFGAQGFPVVSADEVAREVVRPGSATLLAIVERFGQEILTLEGGLDRTRLGAKVFADEKARSDLNAIIHPAIAARSRELLTQLRASGAPLILYEAPLLFEAKATDRVDRVLVVTVPEEEQLRRIRTRDGLDTEAALDRIRSQMSQREKAARADYLIENNGSREELLRKAALLLDRLKREFRL